MQEQDGMKIKFSDVQLEIDGVAYSCDGEAEYSAVYTSREERGVEYEYEGLELTELSVMKADEDGDWVEAPEMENDAKLEAELLEYLDY